MLTTHRGEGGVEVREAGRALKVQSEVPHLVSLGGGRLSTAVTLHPLQEGRMTVGSGNTVDILVQGPGVEPAHCYIDNTGGVVTLFPLAEMTSIDNVRVITPTKLTQGNMVTVGRSNHLRFNHPAEARVMRSVLPNARISMVPLSFYNVSIPGVENVDGIERKPPMAPRRSPRNSWGEVSNSSSCNSGSEETSLMAAAAAGGGGCKRGVSAKPQVFSTSTATGGSPAVTGHGFNHAVNPPSNLQPNQLNGTMYESSSCASYNQNFPVQQSPIPNGVLRNGFQSNGSAFSQTSNTFNSHMSPKSHRDTPTNSPFNNASLNNSTSASRSQTPTLISTQTFTNKSFGIHLNSRSVTASPAFEETRSIAERRLGSLSSLPGINTSGINTSGVAPSPPLARDMNEYRALTTPSPAFNRNPTSSGRNHCYTPRSVTPSPPRPTHVLNGVEHRRTVSVSSQDAIEPLRRVSSPTPSYGSNHSLEELAARKEELEHKRQQAQNDRLREQETEKNERARLEEILSMCADYERQVQLEKQCKSPGIPQNRIKTNGSLPRDKRLPSPGISASEDETDVFTFDQNASGNGLANASTSPTPAALATRAVNGNSSVVGVTRSPYENVVLSAAGIAYPQSPRTRIRTIASKETTPVRDTSEVIENRMAFANDYEFVTSLPRRTSNKSPGPQQALIVNSRSATPQQANSNRPTTPQLTAVANSNSPQQGIVANSNRSTTPQLTALASSNTPQQAALPNSNRPTTPQQYINVSSVHSPQLSRAPQPNNSAPSASNGSASPARKPSVNTKLILPLDINPVDRLSEALEAMKTQNALRNSERRKSMERKKEAGKQERIIQQAGEASVDEEERQQHTLMLMKTEYEVLRKERSKLLAAMSGLKRNITDIEQQEEEMLRELEMERALLDGEWTAQGEKHSQEKMRQAELRRQLAHLDKEVAHFSAREIQRQAECQSRLESAEDKLHKSEIELGSCGDNAERQKILITQVRANRELLEQEKKLFEDLEFRHLEEEANCLAGHEELQRELSDVTQRLEARQSRLAELENQRLEADHAAQLESQGLERQLISNLRKLEEVRNTLRVIESSLEALLRRGSFNCQDSSPDGSSDNEEYVHPSSAQSPEDIARISRVTKGAPLELGSGSLGRKTLESLQTIERNRQLHLVQQGSQVIENERKRVEELKRRVQDEARAQWAEEQRQREKNCYSLNSVGSDEASSDVPTESASSDDTVDKRNSAQVTAESKLEQHELDSTVQPLMREKELAIEHNREETRPLTDGSDYEQQLSVNMRERDKAARLQHQRPLTRYLPIRSERLDLRQHIETAGHQVDLCPHVALDTTTCRGNLHKLGAKFHHWGKRWFVFDRNQRTLTYYSDRTEKKARGGAYFQAIEEVYVDHLNSVKSPNPQLTFVVKTSERTYHLMAPSAEAMRIWVDVVFTGAEGYQEFEHGS